MTVELSDVYLLAAPLNDERAWRKEDDAAYDWSRRQRQLRVGERGVQSLQRRLEEMVGLAAKEIDESSREGDSLSASLLAKVKNLSPMILSLTDDSISHR